MLVPPNPIRRNLYLCSKEFHTSCLEPLFLQEEGDKPTLGVAFILGHETRFYTVCNTKRTLVDRYTIHRQKSQKKGGQSAQRFNRIHDNQVSEYITLVTKRIESLFPPSYHLLIAGTGEVYKHVHKSILLEDRQASLVSCTMETDLWKACEAEQARQEQLRGAKELSQFFDEANVNKRYFGTLKTFQQAMHDGLLHKIFVHQEVSASVTFEMQNGCCLVVVGASAPFATRLLHDYGGIVGLTWYDNSTNF